MSDNKKSSKKSSKNQSSELNAKDAQRTLLNELSNMDLKDDKDMETNH